MAPPPGNDGSVRFSFTAPGGRLFVAGGLVSQIALTRGGTTINAGVTSGYIAVSPGDICTLTYTGAPPQALFV
jgi:hypothetical protein